MDLEELNGVMWRYKNEGKDKIAKNLENLIEFIRRQGEKGAENKNEGSNTGGKQ
ncbi:hypothetical protein M1141_01055 [Candidatus Marsarchaeota archaeon]|nr:hypothetical protein [Candidatus Marsarchaeota archaeon]